MASVGLLVEGVGVGDGIGLLIHTRVQHLFPLGKNTRENTGKSISSFDFTGSLLNRTLP